MGSGERTNGKKIETKLRNKEALTRVMLGDNWTDLMR